MLQDGILRQLLPQVAATFLGTMAAFSDGMTYGWTSPMIPYFLSNATHIPDVTIEDTEWMETTVLFGATAGLPFTITGVNYLGRKKSMILASAMACACWVILLTTNTLPWLFTARFFSGMAGDMCFVAAPMYIAEIADHRVRGFLSATIYLMMLMGITTVYTLGSLCSYNVVPIVGITVTLVQVVFFPLMPETPYYSVLINRRDEAIKSLKRLRGPSADIQQEIVEIEKAIERQRTEKGRPQDLIMVKSNRKALLILLLLNCAQHFVGISVMLMNLHVILEEAGSVYMKSSTAAIIFAVIMLVAATIASVVIDKFGRRILLMTSAVLSGITLLVIAVYFNLKNLNYDVVSVSWIPAVGVMVYAATFKSGLGLVPIVVTAEVFPTSIKGIGMTLADVIYVIASLLSITIYNALYHNFGMHVPFYVFSVYSFFTTLTVWFFVPETKGKTLEEIQLMLKGIKNVDYK